MVYLSYDLPPAVETAHTHTLAIRTHIENDWIENYHTGNSYAELLEFWQIEISPWAELQEFRITEIPPTLTDGNGTVHTAHPKGADVSCGWSNDLAGVRVWDGVAFCMDCGAVVTALIDPAYLAQADRAAWSHR